MEMIIVSVYYKWIPHPDDGVGPGFPRYDVKEFSFKTQAEVNAFKIGLMAGGNVAVQSVRQK